MHLFVAFIASDRLKFYISRSPFEIFLPSFVSSFCVRVFESSVSVISSNVLLQLTKIYSVHFFSWMTFTNVPTSIRDMFCTVTAIRAIEPWLLTAFKFLMISQPSFSTEDAGTIGTGEFPCKHSCGIKR